MSLGEDFLADVRNRFSLDQANMSMTDWAIKHTTIKGRPFSVRGYEFQRAIMDDMHHNLDCIKCSQVGLTEVQIRKALGFAVRNQGTAVLFTLPDEKLYTKVSMSRFNPIIDDDKVFNQLRDKGATRSKEIKQFGRSFVYLTGCTEGDATSTSADVIFNDEVDLSPQNMLALFSSRLQNSNWKISQRFSTPTFPNYGIDLGFQASDQHHYLVKCAVCNHWNWPMFTRDFCVIPGLPDHVEKLTEIDGTMKDLISISESYVVCEHCRSRLDLDNVALRQWVPKFPNRMKDARGYFVTPFSTSRIDLPYIVGQLIQYKSRDYVRGFYNTVLGMTYSDGNIQIPEEAIKACFNDQQSNVPDVGADVPVAVGIDMGMTCHVTVSTLDCKVFLFAAVPADEIVDFVKRLCGKYNVVAGGVDRFPYTPTANEIMKISEGRIMPIEYRGSKETAMVKDPYGNVIHGQANRTQALDHVATLIKTRQIEFSGYGFYKATIIEHLRDQIRDEKPEEEPKWTKRTGRDHYHHSLAALFAGVKLRELTLDFMPYVPTVVNWGVAPIAQPAVHSLFTRPSNGRRSDKIITRH